MVIAGAKLNGTNLRGIRLIGAKMVGVNLREADLTGADLSHTKMVAVDVTGADFSNVETTGARAAVKWSDAIVQPAKLPEAIPLPPPLLPLLFTGVVTLVSSSSGGEVGLKS